MAIQFGICNEIFKDWPLDKIFHYAKTVGYDAVEIAPFTIANHVTDIPASERTRIADSAARADIAISGIHWVLAQTEGMYVTHPEESVRQRTSQYFVELTNFCADIGGKRIVVGSPKQRNLMEGVTYGQAWEWATIVFGDAVKRAEDRGITLCFEPLAPNDTNFINTAEEGIRFTRQLGSAHFKIILDVKAMCSMGKPIPQIIRESKGEFAYFHANDANLKGPGFGEVDFTPIAAALREVGYDGMVSVEVFIFDEGPEAIATRSLEYLKRTFAE